MKKIIVISLNFCRCFSLMILIQLVLDLILPKMEIGRKWIIFDFVTSLFIAVIVPLLFKKNDKGALIWMKGTGFAFAAAFVCYVTLLLVGIIKPSGTFPLVIAPIVLFLVACIGFVSARLIYLSIEKRNLEEINKILEENSKTKL